MAVQEWVLDLPDTQCLLDIRNGIRYPKEQLFEMRQPVRVPPSMRDFPDLPYGHLSGAFNGAQSMMPAAQPPGRFTVTRGADHEHKAPCLLVNMRLDS